MQCTRGLLAWKILDFLSFHSSGVSASVQDPTKARSCRESVYHLRAMSFHFLNL